MAPDVLSPVMLKTNLAGKIRNLPHFKNEALLPLFEAVVNSIQAIEEKGYSSEGTIVVRILRDAPQATLSLGEESLPNINGFEIEDNGIGFNDVNFDSFQTAESTYKLDKGCKGVGRFLWLKAFKTVAIESIFCKTDGLCSKRIFDFNVTNGVKEILHEDVEDLDTKTIVSLHGFYEEYRKQPTAYKTCNKIAQRLFEHSLARFICGLAPNITVIDQDGTTVRLNDLFDTISESIITENFEINGESFTIHHIRLYSTRVSNHQLVFCAHGSRVKSRSIGSLLGTSMQFDGENNKYTDCVISCCQQLLRI